MTIREQWEKAKNEHPDQFILVKVGDFYECYADDARKANKVLNIAITTGNNPVAGFPKQCLDQYLPKIIRNGKRVSIIDANSDNNNSSTNKTSNNMETNNSILAQKINSHYSYASLYTFVDGKLIKVKMYRRTITVDGGEVKTEHTFTDHEGNLYTLSEEDLYPSPSCFATGEHAKADRTEYGLILREAIKKQNFHCDTNAISYYKDERGRIATYDWSKEAKRIVIENGTSSIATAQPKPSGMTFASRADYLEFNSYPIIDENGNIIESEASGALLMPTEEQSALVSQIIELMNKAKELSIGIAYNVDCAELMFYNTANGGDISWEVPDGAVEVKSAFRYLPSYDNVAYCGSDDRFIVSKRK